jgi:hypothetical protein
VVFTFLIMAAVLAFRPQGLLGQELIHGLVETLTAPTPCASVSPDKTGSSGFRPAWWVLGLFLLTHAGLRQ